MNPILTAAALSLLAGAAWAQDTTIKIPPKTLPRVPLELKIKSVANERGDAALAWVSPLLDNHDSRISNNVWTINGRQQHRRFGFSVVNIDPVAPLEVALNCYEAGGKLKSKYSAILTAPPAGAAFWHSRSIAPDRSSDQVTLDLDRVWCALSASKPFAAFGQRNEGDSSNSEIGSLPVILIAVAR